MSVQSVVFDQTKWTTAQARAWLKRNNYVPLERVRKTENTYRYRISPTQPGVTYTTSNLADEDGIFLIAPQIAPVVPAAPVTSTTTPVSTPQTGKGDQKGDGIVDTVKSVANKVKRVLDAIPAPREHAPPSVRNLLKQYGENKVVSCRVFRVPILGVLDKALNLLSLGKFAENKASYGYDKMFHLYLIAILDNGKFIKMERNQTVYVGLASNRDLNPVDTRTTETRNVPGTYGMTLNQFLMGAANDQKAPNFWIYDATKNNCQDFVLQILRFNKLLTPELSAFIKQDVDKLLPDYVSKIGKYITDKASGVDRVLKGDGQRGGRKLTELEKKQMFPNGVPSFGPFTFNQNADNWEDLPDDVVGRVISHAKSTHSGMKKTWEDDHLGLNKYAKKVPYVGDFTDKLFSL